MIYTVGCSFTYGDELSDISSAWPYLLAKNLGTVVVNDGISGGTNYRNVFNTIKNINQNFDLYIIAWTSTARYTFYKSDNNFEINFNPQLQNSLYGNKKFYYDWGKVLYQHWHNNLFSFKIWLQQIIQLQAILEKNKKKYIMLNTVPNDLGVWLAPKEQFINSVKSLINIDLMDDQQILNEHSEIQQYVSLIDTEKFYKWNEFSITNLLKFFPIGPKGHILEDGHLHLSNLLYQYINV